MMGRGRAVLLGLVMLTACGPDSGTPAPTPTPSVTPSPTPTPTPSFSYARADDWTGDRAYTSQLGYRLFYQMPADVSSDTVPIDSYHADMTLLADGDTAAFNYVSATNSAAFRYASEEISFSGAEQVPTTRVGCLAYRGKASPDTLDVCLNSSDSAPGPFAYTNRITWEYERSFVLTGRRELTDRYSLIGQATLPADAAPPAVYADQAHFHGVKNAVGGFSRDVGMTFNVTQSGAVTATVVLPLYTENDPRSGYDRTPVTLNFSGTVDSNHHIAGTVTSTETDGFQGKFRGQLNGPAGAEVAIVFAADRARDDYHFAGDFIARR